MNTTTQTSGIGCFQCGDQATGQCKNNGEFYCAQHGDSGYCLQCIAEARVSTPKGVTSLAWILYALAALVTLLLIVAGVVIIAMALSLGSGTQSGNGGISAMTIGLLIGAPFGVIFWMAAIGLPLYFTGRALGNGSAAARTIVVIISWILILAVPTVIGPIVGIAILLLVNQQLTKHWFAMRRIKRQFAKQSTD